MRRKAAAILAAILFIAGEANADTAALTVGRLLEVCSAPDTETASLRGDELGWRRMTDTETFGWRSSFESHNGGFVDVVGWRRDGSEGSDTLAFWVATGTSGHQACMYSTRLPAGLLDSLTRSLGPPDDIDRQHDIESMSASWRRGDIEYAFTQVGSSALVNISRER